MRWRKHRIVSTGDVEKMYRQIAIHHDDPNLQSIVWRQSTTEPIQDVVLSTVTYGTASAPFLGIETLQQVDFDECKNIRSTFFQVKKFIEG